MISTLKRTSLMKSQLSLHQRLLWWGAACVLIWTLSGLTHPLMSWFGPKQANYRPPALSLTVSEEILTPDSLSLAHLQSIAHLMVASQKENVSIAKVVPSQQGAMLQLTYNQEQPREYLPLTALVSESPILDKHTIATNAVLPQYDQQQAKWLASYYTGRKTDEVEEIEFITEFSGAYPWVNRLLPVYKVRFSGDDQLTAFIHTETSQLASLTNNTRLQLQTLFRTLHTFDFLDEQDNLRVAAVFTAMLILVSVSISGFGLVLLLKRRKIKTPDRRWHRRLGYVIWLPLLAWSISGGYHLIQSAYVDAPSGLRLNDTFNFEGFTVLNQDDLENGNSLTSFNTTLLNHSELEGKSILAASLLNIDQQLILRLSITDKREQSKGPAGPHAHHQQQVKKFKGNPAEKSSLYLDALTLMPTKITDKHRAIALAEQFRAIHGQTIHELDTHELDNHGMNNHETENHELNSLDEIASVQMIHRFGPNYDFRNKRLPVWQVTMKDEHGTQLFVDPATAILVDQSQTIDRAERWSFSMLHKWNFLVPLTGRFKRDIVIVVTLSLLTIITLLGMTMGLKRLKQRRTRALLTPSAEELSS